MLQNMTQSLWLNRSAWLPTVRNQTLLSVFPEQMLFQMVNQGALLQQGKRDNGSKQKAVK